MNSNERIAGGLSPIRLRLIYRTNGALPIGSVAATLPNSAPWLRIALPTSLALFTMMGTVIGVAALRDASKPVMAAVLGFGAVVFTWLATEELLVKAHEQGETAFGSAAFFLGFLCYLLIEQALG